MFPLGAIGINCKRNVQLRLCPISSCPVVMLQFEITDLQGIFISIWTVAEISVLWGILIHWCTLKIMIFFHFHTGIWLCTRCNKFCCLLHYLLLMVSELDLVKTSHSISSTMSLPLSFIGRTKLATFFSNPSKSQQSWSLCLRSQFFGI